MPYFWSSGVTDRLYTVPYDPYAVSFDQSRAQYRQYCPRYDHSDAAYCQNGAMDWLYGEILR